MTDYEAYVKDFERSGEIVVRASLASWNGGQAVAARIWLDIKEAERESARDSSIDAFQASQAMTASRAADAAVRAADAAERANTLAKTANTVATAAAIIAAIAMVIAFFALFRPSP